MFLIAFTKKKGLWPIFLFCYAYQSFFYSYIWLRACLPAVSEHVVVAFVGPRRLFAVGACGRRDRGHGAGAQGGVGLPLVGAPGVARAALGQVGGICRAGGSDHGRGRIRRRILEVHARVARRRLHERLGVVVRETDGFRRGRALGVALEREEKVLGGAEALCHGAVVREQLRLGPRLGGLGLGGGGGGGGGGFRREGRRFEAEHRLERHRRFHRSVADGRAGDLGLPGALQRHRLGRGRAADNARLGVALGAGDVLIAEGIEGVVRLGHLPLEDRPRRAALPALLAAAGGWGRSHGTGWTSFGRKSLRLDPRLGWRVCERWRRGPRCCWPPRG